MRVLEAFWSDRALWVWGMDSELPAATRSRREPRPHPYALGPRDLADEVVSLLYRDSEHRGAVARALAQERPYAPAPGLPAPGTAVLRLPGGPTHPYTPPSLGVRLDAPKSAASRAALRDWEVPALVLHSGDAATLLRTFRSSAPGSGSASLPHLEVLLRAAESFAAARRVVPQWVEEASEESGTTAFAPRARWRPVLDPQAMSWLRSYAGTVPPVLRAHHDPGVDDPREAGSAAVVDALETLCAFTDLAVRERLDGREFRLPAGPRLYADWVHGLLADDGEVPGYVWGREQSVLAGRLSEWFGAVQRRTAALRLALRLVEPALGPGSDADLFPEAGEEADDDFGSGGARPPEPLIADEGASWELEVWVQSADEPSLMLPLPDARADDAADWLPRDREAAIEAALDRAAGLYPRLDREDVREHGSCTLDTAQACAFLTRVAPALSEAGIGLLLPPWAGTRDTTVALRLEEQSASAGGDGIGQRLVEFDYRAALGDVELTAAQLQELARLKAPLLRMRGEWVHLDPARLKAAAAAIAQRGSGTVPEAEALRMALEPTVDGLEVSSVDAGGDLGALLEGRAEQSFAPMEDPPGLKARLRPYQRRGAAWLRYLGRLGLGAVLADDMGLGKTLQVLAVLAEERADAGPCAPTLVVCPTSVIGNWHKEAERFLPGLRVHVQHGAGRPRGARLKEACAGADLVLTTYGTLRRDAEELVGLDWARTVCDEAQHIKNPRTATWKAVRAVPASARVALTGTPVENRLGEFWSIMEFANPGLLGDRQAFEKRTAAAIERGPSQEEGAAAATRLRRATAPFVLRRVKTDRDVIADLPDKQEMKTWCTLTAEQASLYKAAVNEMVEALEDATGIRRKGLVLATMTRLKQICNHPAHALGDGSRLHGRSGKLARLEELLEEMAADGDKTLCFTQYTELGDMLAPHLEKRLGVPVLWMHGGVPRKRRDAMVERFQTVDGPAVFLLSLKAGGTGLNLTAANQVVHVDRWWNPAVEQQATDRAYRIGQTRTVQVRKMICMGTLEERVDEMIERKKALADAVLGGSGEEWLSELSVDELREVVRLAPEAVSG
ncbi:DEAD/DEAH box helicase [Nocardiopsis suaedae]|uniref:DEAD/DEAH box helicase n=1 Tax=Nocardiopsis suaedae TaxID=3018444 RepID=A0ABT4TEV5_9ACTN|nr:DEAD/DEAH box helicase [Nocardiopsis suaedae]MDA2803238.1 DEAD/DEAH box helicase [Nocardiopsis suaedae]